MEKKTHRGRTPAGERLAMDGSTARCGCASLVLVGAVACGGSGTGAQAKRVGTVDPAFATRAQTTCAPYQDYDEAHVFRIEGFNRYDPHRSLLPRVGRYLARNPRHQTLVAALRKLGKPATGSAVWSLVVDDVDKGEALQLRQITLALRKDADGFTRLENQIQTNSLLLHQHLQRSGLPADSACRSVQIDQMLNRTGH